MTKRSAITGREREVLGLLRLRLTNAEIADELFISVRTVESHVSSLMVKLDATDRRELAALADEFILPTRTNLPRPSTSLIGRDDTVQEVVRLLGESRVVTVTGVGGVGKTRLAVEAAAHMEGDFDDGVWFVDLASLEAGDLIASHMLKSMNAPEVPLETPAAALDGYLNGAKCLIVLDNCEHLDSAVADLASHVVGRERSVTILATSRHSLGVAGEVVYELQP
ncbi:MAG: LuxR C-terminal-related transcriptional regulator, partial [Acidimicrobiia bacterium]